MSHQGMKSVYKIKIGSHALKELMHLGETKEEREQRGVLMNTRSLFGLQNEQKVGFREQTRQNMNKLKIINGGEGGGMAGILPLIASHLTACGKRTRQEISCCAYTPTRLTLLCAKYNGEDNGKQA